MPQFEGVCRAGIEGVSFQRLRSPGAIFSPGKFLGSFDVQGWGV